MRIVRHLAWGVAGAIAILKSGQTLWPWPVLQRYTITMRMTLAALIVWWVWFLWRYLS